MSPTVSVVVAAVSVFVLSSIYYSALTPVEARVLGPAAIGRGRPSPAKALLELLRSILVAR